MATRSSAPGGNAVHRFVLAPAMNDADRVLYVDAVSGRSWTRAEVADGVRRAAGALAAGGSNPSNGC